jgi:outer membrane protein TolC
VLSAETNVLAQRRLGVDIRARTLDTQMLLVRALGGGYVARRRVS